LGGHLKTAFFAEKLDSLSEAVNEFVGHVPLISFFALQEGWSSDRYVSAKEVLLPVDDRIDESALHPRARVRDSSRSVGRSDNFAHIAQSSQSCAADCARGLIADQILQAPEEMRDQSVTKKRAAPSQQACMHTWFDRKGLMGQSVFS
jgi:hypothetical protein